MSPAAAAPLALASAVAFGLASALQHGEAGRVDRYGALDPGLLAALARRPRWLVGTGADVLAVGLQALALREGSVALVQTLLVAGLPCAVLLSCLLAGRPLRRPEAGGVLLCSAGLCAITPATASTGSALDPDRVAVVLAAVVLAAATLGLLALARASPALAGLATGAAAGVLTGAGSVLLAACAQRVDDPGRLLRSGLPYATLLVGGLALLVAQAAFQTGALSAPLAALTLLEPAVAVGLALTVLGERLPTSPPLLVLAVLGAVLAVLGVLVLADTAAAWPTGVRE